MYAYVVMYRVVKKFVFLTQFLMFAYVSDPQLSRTILSHGHCDSNSSRSRLRSGSKGGGAARMRLKFGERAFLYTAPDASNSLQRSLQQLSNTASVNNFENGH